MMTETTTRRITAMPSILYTSFIGADDIRRRRMADAAEYREAHVALKTRRGGLRARGEPAGCPAPARPRPRWLALP